MKKILALADDLFWTGNKNFLNVWNNVETNDLFNLVYEAYDLVFATSLNAAARPVAGMPDLEYQAGYVAVTPTNIFAGLSYALGGSAWLSGPWKTGDWQTSNAPDGDQHKKPWLTMPLLAPTNGPTGFYRVFVAPYAPSK